MNKLEKIKKAKKLCSELMDIYEEYIDVLEEEDIDDMITRFSIAIAAFKIRCEEMSENDDS